MDRSWHGISLLLTFMSPHREQNNSEFLWRRHSAWSNVRFFRQTNIDSVLLIASGGQVTVGFKNLPSVSLTLPLVVIFWKPKVLESLSSLLEVISEVFAVVVLVDRAFHSGRDTYEKIFQTLLIITPADKDVLNDEMTEKLQQLLKDRCAKRKCSKKRYSYEPERKQ